MPKVIIPDKICSHCGGNEWYVFKNNIRCNLKAREGRSRYKKSDKAKERRRIITKSPEYLKKQREYSLIYYSNPKNKEKRLYSKTF